MALLFLFLVGATLHVALGQTYYVESAPVAPFSCTITQPCRVSDLPSSFTTAATIVFLPATTGTKSMYVLGNKNFLHPSLVFSPGTIFNNSRITATSSDSVICNSSSFIVNSAITVATADSVQIESCNFTSSSVTTVTVGDTDMSNCYVTALSGGQGIQLGGDNISVTYLTMTFSTTSGPPLEIDTGSSNGGDWFFSHFTATNLTTTGTASTVLLQSMNGWPFGFEFDTFTFSNVTSASAFIETKVLAATGVPGFAVAGNFVFPIFNGGSCANGLFYSNSQNGLATLNSQITQTVATGVNFKNGPAFLLHSAGGWDVVDAYTSGTNFICAPINQAYLAKCGGTIVDTIFEFNGYDNSTLATLNCPHIVVNAFLICPA
jgi:hypothetical protein